VNEVLLGAKISLGRLDPSVAQQQLYLLKLAATGAAQLRAGAAEVMRSYTRDCRCVGVGLNKLPHDLFAQGFACNAVSAIYRTED
jgi:hypothetical protein